MKHCIYAWCGEGAPHTKTQGSLTSLGTAGAWGSWLGGSWRGWLNPNIIWYLLRDFLIIYCWHNRYCSNGDTKTTEVMTTSSTYSIKSIDMIDLARASSRQKMDGTLWQGGGFPHYRALLSLFIHLSLRTPYLNINEQLMRVSIRQNLLLPCYCCHGPPLCLWHVSLNCHWE